MTDQFFVVTNLDELCQIKIDINTDYLDFSKKD
jgi:hypothetical protein